MIIPGRRFYIKLPGLPGKLKVVHLAVLKQDLAGRGGGGLWLHLDQRRQFSMHRYYSGHSVRRPTSVYWLVWEKEEKTKVVITPLPRMVLGRTMRCQRRSLVLTLLKQAIVSSDLSICSGRIRRHVYEDKAGPRDIVLAKFCDTVQTIPISHSRSHGMNIRHWVYPTIVTRKSIYDETRQ
jgi:hypothetical protein